MQRALLVLFVLLFGLTGTAFAQFTLTRADVEALLNRTITQTDFQAQSPAAAAVQTLIDRDGANKTWDLRPFTFVQGETLTSQTISPVGNQPGANDPAAAGATFVQTAGKQDSTAYLYMRLENDRLISLMSYAVYGNSTLKTTFSPARVSQALPFTYGTKWEWQGTSTTTGTVSGTTNMKESYEVDAWGTVITPEGSFEALRLESKLEVPITGGFTSTTYAYTWITRQGRAVASMSKSSLVGSPFPVPDTYGLFYTVYGTGGGGTQPPAAVALVSPADGATGVGTSPTLSWSPAATATSYTVQVATDAAFSNVVVEQTGIATTTASISGLSGNTTYHWRVQGVNAGGAGTFSAAFRFTTASGVAVEPVAGPLPEVFALQGNYPNPFNPTTAILFDLPEAAVVRLTVYDAAGRLVAVLAEEALPAGRHQARFDARGLPSGLYLYRLVTPHHTAQGRMLLLK